MAAPGFFFRDGEDSPLLVALHADVVAAGTRLSVSAQDEMFMAFYYGRGESLEAALHMYVESGQRIWRALRAAIEWRFGGLERVGSLLDFAAGYGRVTRFIATDLPPERLWIAEIDRGAVAFQEETFGVHGLATTPLPEEFAPGRDFDCILVSSLFTHLPEERFRGWLARLLARVRPGGLLALSVHDAALSPEEAGRDFSFRPQSESGSLPGAEYGSTWVSEGYVRGEVRALAGGGELAVHRIPRGLASYQDLYLVTKGGAPAGGEDGAALRRLRGGADGHVEDCRLTAARRLELAGWVTDRATRRPVRQLAALLDGSPVARTSAFADRPEVAAAFAGDAAAGQGWRLEVPLPLRCDLARATLRLAAEGDDGFETCLVEGSLEAMIARGALMRGVLLEEERAALRADLARAAAHLREVQAAHRGELARRDLERERLQAEIAAMRNSRFWKLRDRWFAVKRWLRLTTEP
jgi:SAM-dependent methyltransferase